MDRARGGVSSMPWTGPQFRQRHNHSLSPEQAAHAARIANAILKRSGNEGIAIATANKMARRDDGGSVEDTSDDASLHPSVTTANPLVQGMIQRYASMPTDRLQQLSVMLGGSPQASIVQRILQQRRMTPAQNPDPAQQQQQQQADGGGIVQHRADGGMESLSMADPPWSRAEARSSQGFLHGVTPGRADQINTAAPGGSYVLPAEVVAGLGEGNSLAGARAVEEMLRSGPHGIPMPRGGPHRGPPAPPRPYQEATGGYIPKATEVRGIKLFRAGGVPGDGSQPVMLSDGEYVVGPEDVSRFGNGDHAKGVKWFDRWVMDQHRKHIAKLKRYRGPVKEGED